MNVDETVARIERLAESQMVDHLTFWTHFAYWWEQNFHLITLREAITLCETKAITDQDMPWMTEKAFMQSAVAYLRRT
jgi:hypothetical protein